MNQLGIYCTVFPLASQAFITEQVSNLVRYEPTFLMRSQGGELNSKRIAIQDRDVFRLKQTLFSLTGSPLLWGRSKALSQLNLIHAHFGPDGIYAMALAKQLNIPLIVTYHGFDATISYAELWRKRKPSVYQFLLKEHVLKEQAAKFIAVSKFLEKKLIERGYPKDKIIQHYIGVDTAKFVPRYTPPDERYIFCVARHTGKKGLDVLLKAFSKIAKKYPSVSLVQVGNGTMTAELYSLVERLGIKDRVRFLGAQPHKKVLELMRQAEIFALPSQTAKDGDSEALGIVFNEASACGIPIVATWHGGIPEAVLDGETGFLIPEKDVNSLSEKLDALLADRALGERMGKQGRDYVCEIFDIRKQTTKLELIYDEILQNSNSSNQREKDDRINMA